VERAVAAIRPSLLVLVGKTAREMGTFPAGKPGFPGETMRAETLAEGRAMARSRITAGSLVLAVKTWR
jgi:hypothetical protein